MHTFWQRASALVTLGITVLAILASLTTLTGMVDSGVCFLIFAPLIHHILNLGRHAISHTTICGVHISIV